MKFGLKLAAFVTLFARCTATELAPENAKKVEKQAHRNLVSCFARVLIDGGENRIFTAEDKQTFDEDFCAIKAAVHRIEELSDVGAMVR